MSKKKPKTASNTIAQNRKARHDYHLSDKVEAGVVLLGWEVKSLREGMVQITDSYVFMQNGEAWLLNANITPLKTACTHYVTEPTRNRKLLLNKRELAKLLSATQKDSYTAVCTKLYWKGHLVKAEVCIGKGKQAHDKRDNEKDRDWDRQKQRVMRQHN